MGGQNEAFLPADKPNSGVILPPDKTNVNMNSGIILPPDETVIKMQLPIVDDTIKQTQTIRQHMSAGQIHLHCDDQKLKVAIPVAEWYLVLRQLRSLNEFTWVDSENKCLAYIRPYINDNLFEVAIELIGINIGPRFEEMNKVTKK